MEQLIVPKFDCNCSKPDKCCTCVGWKVWEREHREWEDDSEHFISQYDVREYMSSKTWGSVKNAIQIDLGPCLEIIFSNYKKYWTVRLSFYNKNPRCTEPDYYCLRGHHLPYNIPYHIKYKAKNCKKCNKENKIVELQGLLPSGLINKIGLYLK